MRQFKTIVILAVSILLNFTAYSQSSKPLPLDSKVTKGVLPNGMTYYIRHNEEPKGLAYFYIAQKVGSIQEEPSQRGLAHFLEHMCFNGTKNFKGNSLIRYLESIGVKFGADLNAYTSIDETVYNIDNVPVSVKGAIDSCLYILHDWSHDLTLDDEEIDKERGVIEEEWRMRNNANQRLAEAQLPVIFQKSKYADCMPIGNIDVVRNFPYQRIKDYYEKWYRPDLQGIIIVGDIDVKEIEKKIKSIFADIPAPGKNAAKRVYYPVPDNKAPIIFIGTDKEYSEAMVTLYFKHDATPKEKRNTEMQIANNIYDSFISTMFHARLSEIAQKAGTPFGFGNGANKPFYVASTKDAFNVYVSCHHDKTGDVEKGFGRLMVELQRVKLHGFTQSEVDRMIADFKSSVEDIYNTRNKRYSSAYVNDYVRSFLDNDPAVSVEQRCEIYNKILNEITAEKINERFNSYFNPKGENLVITLMAKEDSTIVLPNKAELLAMYEKGIKENPTPYIDNASNMPFLPKDPVPGKIISSTTDANGIIHKELSNGAKVLIRKTDFKKENIQMTVLGKGGASLFPEDLYKYNQLLNMTNSVCGLGNYSVVQLGKYLAGCSASVNSGVGDNIQTVTGSCSSKDIAKMMELTHASFLYPHKDTCAFRALTDRYSKSTEKSKDMANTAFGEAASFAKYGSSGYAANLTSSEIRKADIDILQSLYKERFNDASNFTFIFIGDINETELDPLLEKYIASLPATNKAEMPKPINLLRRGNYTCHFEYEQETDISKVSITCHGNVDYNLKNYIMSSMLGQLLSTHYTRTIREEAGAAYSVGAGASNHTYPENYIQVVVQFTTAPEKRDMALALVQEGFDEIAKKGPSEEDLNKIKEYLLKTCESNRKVNDYWVYIMQQQWYSGLDIDSDYMKIVKDITTKDIQEFAESIFNQGNKIEVVMSTPKK